MSMTSVYRIWTFLTATYDSCLKANKNLQLRMMALLKYWPPQEGKLQKVYLLNDGKSMKVSYENEGKKIFAKRQTTYSPG